MLVGLYSLRATNRKESDVTGLRHHFYLAVTLMLLSGPLALGNDGAASSAAGGISLSAVPEAGTLWGGWELKREYGSI
jgi:hypothetical protein